LTYSQLGELCEKSDKSAGPFEKADQLIAQRLQKPTAGRNQEF
jgi:hypothetical protein